MDGKFLVFVVDDEPIFLEMLKDELAENPLLVVVAFESGETCLENLYKNPDIIVLDHNLSKTDPDAKDGMEVLDEIQNDSPNSHVIVLTGQVFPDVTFDYIMKKDVAKYIVKGENAFDELKATIERIVDMLE